MEIDENIIWCPKCKAEYYTWAKTCSDCLVDLVNELPEEDNSPRDRLAPMKLLASVADESEAEAITSLLAADNIQVAKKLNEDNDAIFAIDLYVLEPLVREALTILHRQDGTEGEVFSEDGIEDEGISEIEIVQDGCGRYTGLQLFKKSFADEEDGVDITVAPGRRLLIITGVLYFTLSGLFIIWSLMDPNLSLSFILTFLLFSYRLFIGIMGIKYSGSVTKANLLCVLVVADLLIYIYFLIRYAVLVVQMQLAVPISVFIIYVFEFALPSLYLAGAQKNRSAKRKYIDSQ